MAMAETETETEAEAEAKAELEVRQRQSIETRERRVVVQRQGHRAEVRAMARVMDADAEVWLR